MAKEEMLFFDNDALLHVNTDLLFYILAHQKTILHLRNEMDRIISKEEVTDLVWMYRKQIIEDMYSQYGHTPDIKPKP